MAHNQQESPQFDERVREILKGLAEGKSREALAKAYDHKSWKTLDIYMRRRHFKWDSRDQTYVPKMTPTQQLPTPTDSSKAGQVVSLLSKEGNDLRTIAQRMGFKDHLSLAQYMASRGYEWDSEQGNYVKKVGKVEENDEKGVNEGEMPSDPQAECEQSHPTITGSADLNRFVPLLELLEKHKDRLLDLVIPGSEKGKLPRYVVPGIAKTKTVQMMNPLEQLVVDFSREKNISQREIFEVALIEFFRKYGYDYEIDNLLGER